MIRLLIFLVLLAAPTWAFPVRSGTTWTGCYFTGSTTIGSCINFANGDTLVSSDGGVWSFTNASTLHSTSAGGFTVVARGGEAIFCKSALYYHGAIGFNWSSTVWWSATTYNNGPVYQQRLSPCVDSSSYFLVNGSSVTSLFTACQTSAASAQIEIKANPVAAWEGIDPAQTETGSGLGCQIVSVGTSGSPTVFSLDSGTTIADPYSANGAAGIELHAVYQTINCAGAKFYGANYKAGSGINEMIDAVSNAEVNSTIEGTSGNHCTIDCQASTGQEYAGDGATGILTGPPASGASTITVSYVNVQNCGTYSSGQNHGIYLGWGGNLMGNDAYEASLSNDNFINCGGDTVCVKLDTYCGASQCFAQNVAEYVTINSQDNDVNEAIGFQCGGYWKLTNIIMEMYGQPGFTESDQAFFSKINWVGSSGCPSTLGPTNNIHYSQTYVIYDGPTNGTYLSHKQALCGFAGNETVACNSATGSFPTLCMESSILINNGDATAKLIVGSNAFTDTGCSTTGTDSNVYYSTRSDACHVLGNISGFTGWNNCLSGTFVGVSYTNGAWPYEPDETQTFPTQAQQATAAALASCSGSGTQASPYTGCT